MLAPQPNMTMERRNGTTVQVISSVVDPCKFTPISLSLRRRYFTKQKKITKVMSAEKNTQVIRMKNIKASMLPAKLDACSGNNGSCDCTVLVRSLQTRSCAGLPGTRGPAFPPAEEQNPHKNRGDSEDAAHTDDPEDRRAVAGGRRIVLETEQQDVIRRRADLSRGGFHKAQAHIARRKIHAEEIARDTTVGGQEQDAARVGEEIRFLVIGEAEIRGPRELVNGIFRSRQEMPPGHGFGAAEARHRRLLLLAGHVRGFARVEADEDNLVIPRWIEGDRLERGDDALLELIAEHRAAVIDEHQHDRLLPEIGRERNVAPVLVAERHVQRQASVELGIKSDTSQ